MARRLTAEREQQALYRFEAVFSGWVISHSPVVGQLREAFERERKGTATWDRDAFAQWLPAEAKAEVCAELRRLREQFRKEIEAKAAGEISISPGRMTVIVRCADHLVWQVRRRTKRQERQNDHRALKAYKASRRKARDDIKEEVEKVGTVLWTAAKALRSLPAPEDNPFSSDMLSDVQSLLDESLFGQAVKALQLLRALEDDPFSSDLLSRVQSRLDELGFDRAIEPLDIVGPPSEKLSFMLNEVGRRLQEWGPRESPLWRSFLDPLLRLYEKASCSFPKASWTRPADGGKGRPASPFNKWLMMIVEALPSDVRPFVSTTTEGVNAHAKTLILEHRIEAAADLLAHANTLEPAILKSRAEIVLGPKKTPAKIPDIIATLKKLVARRRPSRSRVVENHSAA